MRVVVTRPQADAERTAAALRARGHEVLVAPLMTVEPVAADLTGEWAGVIATSANALGAARAALHKLPLYAVGERTAQAAREAGFAHVTSAAGDARDLVRLVAARCTDVMTPLLYLAGEGRAADIVGELAARNVAAEMRVVYRIHVAPFPPALIGALDASDVDAVLHFSRRSAENYVAGAQSAGLAAPALAVRHFCLADPVAEPLRAAGAARIAVAPRPDETALLALLPPPA